MKRILSFLLLLSLRLYSQADLPPDQIVEPETEAQRLEEVENLRRRKLCVNSEAEMNLLLELGLVGSWQIQALLSFRQSVGDIPELLCLQAVPGWDTALIRQLIPLLSCNCEIGRTGSSAQLRHQALLRISPGSKQALKNAVGSSASWQVKYKVDYGQQWRGGLSLEKDNGEKGLPAGLGGTANFNGFIEYRGSASLRRLVAGKYQLSFGQGLVCGQGYMLARGSDIAALERTGAALRPLTGTGETDFLQGVAAEIELSKQVRFTAAISYNRQSGNLEKAGDGFTSLKTDGYYRTQSDVDKRANLTERAIAIGVRWKRIGMQTVGVDLSREYHPAADPYQVFKPRVSRFLNSSIDGAGNIGPVHIFGELAMDQRFSVAGIGGVMWSPARQVDLGVQLRYLAPQFFAWFGKALTDQSRPSNEHGIFAHLSLRPAAGWKIRVISNVVCYPWLRYQVHLPSTDSEFQLNLQKDFTRKLRASLRLRWRYDGYSLQKQYNLRLRVEWEPFSDMGLTINAEQNDLSGSVSEQGWAQGIHLKYKISRRLIGRCMLNHYYADSYASRLYYFDYILPGYARFGAIWGTGFVNSISFRYKLLSHLEASTSMNFGNKADLVEGQTNASQVDPDQNLTRKVNFQLNYVF